MATTSFGGAVKHGELSDLTLDQHGQYALWSQGPLANRPAFGRGGRFFYATDNGVTYYDAGTAWSAQFGLTASAVNKAGDTMTGNLTISAGGLTVSAGTTWAATTTATTGTAGIPPFRFSGRGVLGGAAGSTGNTQISDNLYYDGTNWRLLNTSTGLSTGITLSGGAMSLYSAPAGNAGDIVTLTGKFATTANGGITLTGGANLGITIGDGTRTGTFALAATNGNYHPNSLAGDVAMRGDSNTQGVILAAGPSTTGYLRVSPTDVTVGNNLTSVGKMIPKAIYIPDTRNVNDAPSVYVAANNLDQAIRWEFKGTATIGLSDGLSSYAGVETISPWGDDSGGGVTQVAYTASGLWTRYGTRSGGWGSWKKVSGMQINQMIRSSVSVTYAGTSAAATIPSVNTSKSELFFLGTSTAAPTNGASNGRVEFVSATQINIYNSADNYSGATAVTGYQVTEWI